MNERLSEPEYQLVWPRVLFAAEAARLLNDRDAADWSSACQLLLTDAFVRGYPSGPAREFADLSDSRRSGRSQSSSILTSEQRFLRELVRDVSELQENPAPQRPLWRERKSDAGVASKQLTISEVIDKFIALVGDLDCGGYFDQRFGPDCMDEPRGSAPSELLQRRLGAEKLWPLETSSLVWDSDLFFDIVEYLHDSAARPRRIVFGHSNFGEVCEHFGDYDRAAGRRIYRWRVNQIFERSDVGLQLAGDGEDVGRLISVTDQGRTDLVQAVMDRHDESGDADQVRQAVVIFRSRGADRSQKQLAITKLYMVLEERRNSVVASAMTRKDNAALFHIANQFHIRHQNASQLRDYDDYYLDWVFWLYLSSVELTNRVLDDQAAAGGRSA